MSATNRGAERHKDDFYATPDWCVYRLIEWMDKRASFLFDTWLEPCVGGGAIVKAVEARKTNKIAPTTWHVNDINQSPRDLPNVTEYTVSDFLSWRNYTEERPYTAIVTNPPYALAQEFIEQSLKFADHVFMLLRVNFLGSVKRANWLRALTPAVLILPNRPCFALNDAGKPGSDATEYAWFGFTNVNSWMQNHLEILNLTPAEEIKAAKAKLLQSS